MTMHKWPTKETIDNLNKRVSAVLHKENNTPLFVLSSHFRAAVGRIELEEALEPMTPVNARFRELEIVRNLLEEAERLGLVIIIKAHMGDEVGLSDRKFFPLVREHNTPEGQS